MIGVLPSIRNSFFASSLSDLVIILSHFVYASYQGLRGCLSFLDARIFFPGVTLMVYSMISMNVHRSQPDIKVACALLPSSTNKVFLGVS